MRRQPQARATKARSRIDAFHELEARLQSTRSRGEVRLDVKASRIGTKIFEAKEVGKRFGELVILDKFNYNFTRYEKLAVLCFGREEEVLQELRRAHAPSVAQVDLLGDFGHHVDHPLPLIAETRWPTTCWSSAAGARSRISRAPTRNTWRGNANTKPHPPCLRNSGRATLRSHTP